jgi:hypothetical protein
MSAARTKELPGATSGWMCGSTERCQEVIGRLRNPSVGGSFTRDQSGDIDNSGAHDYSVSP